MSADDRRTKVRGLNDAFRTTLDHRLGRVMITAGVDALSNVHKTLLLERVRTFDGFTSDVRSRWRAVSHRWGRFRHPALRTGRASFPASGSLCAAHGLRVGLMVAMAR